MRGPYLVLPLLLIILSISSTGTVQAQDNSSTPLPAKESFKVEVPKGDEWQIVSDGPLPGVEDSHNLTIVNTDKGIQLNVITLPSLENARTLAAAKKEWEKGFLEKATKKVASKPIKLDGRAGHCVVATLDVSEDLTMEIVGVLMIENGRDFMLTFAKAGGNTTKDPDVLKFVKSFKILGGKNTQAIDKR